jgi:hypothetical protein
MPVAVIEIDVRAEAGRTLGSSVFLERRPPDISSCFFFFLRESLGRLGLMKKKNCCFSYKRVPGDVFVSCNSAPIELSSREKKKKKKKTKKKKKKKNAAPFT